MGREFELKYRADDTVLGALAAEYGPFITISMETTYYDTPGRELSKRHWTLRRRFENGISVCTVKTPDERGGRGEWEVRCNDIEAAIPLLVEQGAPLTLVGLTASGIRESCAARFTRLAALLEAENCTVELALDKGTLLGGGKEQPFAEVEVELKSGSEAAAIRFAEALAEKYRLTREMQSKIQRALALANP